MNKTLWIVGAVVLIVLGIWMYRSNQKEIIINTDTTGTPVATTTPDTTKGTTGTTNKVALTGILAQKGNFECKYEQVEQSFRSTNTVYLSSGKIRGEFRLTSATSSVSNMVVYDGSYVYAWKEGMSTGTRTMKATISDIADILPSDLTSGKIFGSSSQNVSWDCHSWSPKAVMLAKPAGVTFK